MTKKQCDGCGVIFNTDKHAIGKVTLSVYDSCHLSWGAGNGHLTYDFCALCIITVEKLIDGVCK